VVPDRPGYGRTGGRATGFVGNARALVGLLDRLGVEEAIVVGHSWGGGVAIAAAEMYPQRFTGLVLAASVAPSERLGWNDRILAAPVIGELIAGLTIGLGGRMLGSSPIQLLAERRLAGRSQDAIKALAKMTGARAGTRVWQSFVSEQRALISELDELAPAVGSLRMPTAVLNGGLDRIVPASVGAHLARSIPDAVHTVLPHSGHLLPHDHPDSIATAVVDVWDRGQKRPEGHPAGSAPSDGHPSDGHPSDRYQTDK
jgi:pimeloyl-ACP methyl ester carboxylesterase